MAERKHNTIGAEAPSEDYIMKLKTIALHLAYDIGSAAIGLAADKLRSGVVQRQNAPKAKGNDLQEIRDPFEEGPIKVNARVALEDARFDDELLELGAKHLKDYAPKLSVKLDDEGRIAGLGQFNGPVAVGINEDGLYINKAVIEPIAGDNASPFVKIDGETYMRNDYTPGKLDIARKLFIELTEDDVSAINYSVTAIYGTRDQKGPTAIIKREDLTKIYSILLKLQHKAAAT